MQAYILNTIITLITTFTPQVYIISLSLLITLNNRKKVGIANAYNTSAYPSTL